MTLKHLSILNFKNITQAELDFSSGVNCFIGSNGQGKTNLLDAIYFLSLCKSSNCSIDSLVISHGQQFLALRGDYEGEDGTPETIHCGLKRGQKKIFRRGAKPYKRLSGHIGLIPLVLVSPDDQLLISGGSEERRRFMDVVIAQYDATYLEALVRYNKALQQRNALLKMEVEPDAELMDVLEEEMASHGEYIHAKRNEYIQSLEPIFQHYYRHISLNRESVALRYTSQCQRGPLIDTIRTNRFRDRAVGYSLHGVHKDDLEMTLGDYPIRREGSQGQSKTFLIALKMAQFDYLRRTRMSTIPLLLLDDIFDKLDAERVEQIVHLVSGDDFGQIFITDTNRDHLDRILSHITQPHKLFHVQEGGVCPQ